MGQAMIAMNVRRSQSLIQAASGRAPERGSSGMIAVIAVAGVTQVSCDEQSSRIADEILHSPTKPPLTVTWSGDRRTVHSK